MLPDNPAQPRVTPLQRVEATLARIFDRRLALFGLCIAVGAVVSWALGQDANWDLRNYHLYIPFALLEGRWGIDLVPASLQSFFNPLADIPYYLVSMKLLPDYPRLVAAFQGTYFGILLFVVLVINTKAFVGRTDLPVTTGVVAALIGVTAAGTVSEIGTTFNDIQSAALILGSVLMLMPSNTSGHDATISPRCAILAGAAFGLSAGVKLTGVLFLPALLVAVIAGQGSIRRAIRPLFLFGIGFAVVALVCNGWWSWRVYDLTGNPVFPVYNAIIRSDWYPPADYGAAGLIRPKPFRIALVYPFAWTKMNFWIISEVPFRDARFAAAWIAGVFIIAISLVALVAKKSVRSAVIETLPTTPPMRFVVAFAFAAYLIWLIMVPVLRYGIPSEVFTGTIIVIAVELIATGLVIRGARSTVAIVLALVIGAAFAAHTVYPSWGRVPYGEKVFSISMPELPPQSLVVLAGVPLGHVVPLIRASQMTAIGVSHHTVEARGYKLFEETRTRIQRHRGQAFVITNKGSPNLRGVIQEFGLTWRDDSCQGIRTNLDSELALCVATIQPASK